MRYLFAFLAIIAAAQIYVIAAPNAGSVTPQELIEPAVLEIRDSNQNMQECDMPAIKSTWTSIDDSQFKAVTVHEPKDDGSCTP
ncbi:MAG TPA: hypothetical protein EYG51_10110 [Pseudomonadales bacterium]|nr:hypothetical protein [Pseudomonadales bacterium]